MGIARGRQCSVGEGTRNANICRTSLTAVTTTAIISEPKFGLPSLTGSVNVCKESKEEKGELSLSEGDHLFRRQAKLLRLFVESDDAKAAFEAAEGSI